MKNFILISMIGLSSLSLAESGIPYAVSCKGKSGETSVSLVSAEFSGSAALKRLFSTPNGKFAPIYFTIQRRSENGDLVNYSTFASVMFAGGGSFTGNLVFNSLTGRGTWTEKVSTFDESKGIPVSSIKKFQVSCEEAQ